ncbi:MAG: T9SS type A sorting domain-containing protein [Cyclobacteriaceae bacterium]
MKESKKCRCVSNLAWYVGPLIILVFGSSVYGQTNLAPGTWRYHLSYNLILNLAISEENIFAANESGVLVFNRKEKNITTFNKLNGLSNSGITNLKYDAANAQLLVAYEDGGLDFIRENTITNFSRLKDAGVTGPKKVNHISVKGNLAFFSTNYGVVVFDLLLHEIKETWRDLGVSGQILPVLQSAFLNDSIFIATAKGVMAGDLNDNLLDYRNWKRYTTGNFSGIVSSLTLFNNQIYATGPTGVYAYQNGVWSLQNFLQNEVIVSLTSSAENLLMIQDSTLWAVNAAGGLVQMADDLITSPAIALQDDQGIFWVGDRKSGLVSSMGGTFTSYLPNGPSISQAFRMVYENGKLFTIGGGYNSSGKGLKIPGEVNVFEDGMWTHYQEAFPDVTDIAFSDGNSYVSTFGSGIAVRDQLGNKTMFDESNSPLKNSGPDNANIPALEISTDGLWVLNYGSDQSLHLFKGDQTWESFYSNFPNTQNPVDLSLDQEGAVWIALNPLTGGGLLTFQKEKNLMLYKTNAAGSGGLPDKYVNAIASDLNGNTWVGTNGGVAYFFSPGQDAIIPIFENRFLLRDEKITAIDVDGGNRKWIGTQKGVWLFNPVGESLIHNFTAENSALLSNGIIDIEINDDTGEVFFATEQGIVSYQSDANTGGSEFKNVKIFPNPVMAGFQGLVGISGLANNALIKITDISGKLVWQSQANGGMAHWNVKDYNGRRLTTGIYLIFAASNDGAESMVGKIAIIE